MSWILKQTMGHFSACFAGCFSSCFPRALQEQPCWHSTSSTQPHSQSLSPVALGWTEAVVFRALCLGRCLGLPWSVQIPRQRGLKLCLLRIYWLLPQWLSAIKASFNATPKESSQPSVLGGSEPLAAARCGAGHRRCSVFLPRPQDGSKPAETSQPQSSTTGYSQPSLGYGQSNYSYPQVPASYPMQPVTAPPSYPPTR